MVETQKEGRGFSGYHAYIQSMALSCVKLNMNSSTTRSTPTVRLTSSSSASAELLKMKLCW